MDEKIAHYIAMSQQQYITAELLNFPPILFQHSAGSIVQ